jgi:uncharacterized membrane protein
MRAITSTVVRFFLTGVATLLPLVVTVFVVSWAVRIADAYIGPSSYLGMLIAKIVGNGNRYQGYLSGYLIVVLSITLLGFLVNRATIAKIHGYIDSVFARIPLFGRIYMTVGQLVDLFGKNDHSGLDRFGGVGHVRLGNVKMLGLLTSSQEYTMEDGKNYLLVFVPNSPIPATGFNVLVLEEDFMRMEMPVEDMIKLLMSLGLLGPQVLEKRTAQLRDRDTTK